MLAAKRNFLPLSVAAKDRKEGAHIHIQYVDYNVVLQCSICR